MVMQKRFFFVSQGVCVRVLGNEFMDVLEITQLAPEIFVSYPGNEFRPLRKSRPTYWAGAPPTTNGSVNPF
jgi:hypothetical protein